MSGQADAQSLRMRIGFVQVCDVTNTVHTVIGRSISDANDAYDTNDVGADAVGGEMDERDERERERDENEVNGHNFITDDSDTDNSDTYREVDYSDEDLSSSDPERDPDRLPHRRPGVGVVRNFYLPERHSVAKPAIKPCKLVNPCAICFEQLEQRLVFCRHVCGRVFHTSCVESLQRCPICRSTFGFGHTPDVRTEPAKPKTCKSICRALKGGF